MLDGNSFWVTANTIFVFVSLTLLDVVIGLSVSSSSSSFTGASGTTVHAVYAGHPDRWQDYRLALTEALVQRELHHVELSEWSERSSEIGDADVVDCDYILYSPNGPLPNFSRVRTDRLKAVLSLFAGVETVASDSTLPTSIPLARMVDPGLVQGMIEYVVGHCLNYHLETDRWRRAGAVWSNDESGEFTVPLARQRTVGILGMGQLGRACAKALRALQFQVTGWTRRPSPESKEEEENGIIHHWGDDGLVSVLQASDIVVLLLPATAQTRHVLCRETLNLCKPGVCVINVGRGSLINDEDLLAALDSGHVAGATLDVFEVEPLPSDHRYWHHPNVLVTPHVAAKTRPKTAAGVLADQIGRCERGEPLLYRVDREAGY